MRVNITDLNDNPPIISRNHSNVIVQEGTQPGTTLLELFLNDIDSSSNSAPFQCTLFNGDSQRFVVLTLLATKCVIQTKVFLNMNERDTYDLVVRVTDSGKHLFDVREKISGWDDIVICFICCMKCNILGEGQPKSCVGIQVVSLVNWQNTNLSHTLLRNRLQTIGCFQTFF